MRSAIYILLIAVPVLFGCKKKETTGDPSGNTSAPNSFVLKKDGVNFTPAQIQVSLPDENIVLIKAMSVAGEPEENAYQFLFDRHVQPGVYSVTNGTGTDFLCYYYPAPGLMYTSQNGTMTVNSNDTVARMINASFEFTIHNDGDPVDPVITNGSLIIHY